MNEGILLALIMVGSLGVAVVFIYYRDLIFPNHNRRRSVNTYQVRRPSAAAPAGNSAGRSAAAPAHKPRSKRSNELNQRSALQNAEPATVQRSNVQPERSEQPAIDNEPPAEIAISITPKELTQLADAIRFHAAGQSKQSSLEAAFGISKGGSDGWKRASRLFDQAQGKGA